MNKSIWMLLMLIALAGCGGSDGSGSGSTPDDPQTPTTPTAPNDGDDEPDPTEDEPAQPVVVSLEENQAGFCDIDGRVESEHAGFSGDGYANVENASGSAITWQVEAQDAGSFDIELQYAATTDRPATVLVNGSETELAFPATAAWDDWSTQTATLSLEAGTNDIVLSSNTAEGMPNIDTLTITGVGLSAGTCLYTPATNEADVQVFVVGDSTVASYGASSYPQAGWGQVLQHYFEEDTIAVDNRARGGRSSKSYKVDGIWDEVLNDVGEGDYVLIQFGHNDRDWTKEERYTTTDEFEGYLTEYVEETRAKSATPILVSPMVMNAYRDGTLRNVFTEEGNDYAGSMAKVATDLSVPYVDLNAASWELVNSLGQEQASHYLYLILEPGEYENYPDGSSDGTHFQEFGAVEMARLVVEGLEALNGNEALTTLINGIAPRYSLTVEQAGATGSIVTPGNSYPAGTPLTFKVRAGGSDTFDAWYAAGQVISEENLYTTTMPVGKLTMIAAFNGVVPEFNYEAATAYLIGDSTVADYPDGYYPQTGWGQVFQHYLDDTKITVDNRALGGRSSKSYYENHWVDVKSDLQQGDYLLIQFGINDRSSDPDRSAPTGGVFEGYMTSFVEEAREVGAVPIFVTTVRRNQWKDGEPYDAYHEHPVVTRELAADLGVPLIDLNAKNEALLVAVGEHYANEFYYMGFGAGQYGNDTAESDTVHFQKQGAVEMARLVSEGIQELAGVNSVAPLVNALKPTFAMDVSSPTPGAGSFTQAFDYPSGTPMTLKALANEGDEFTQWLDASRTEVSTDFIYEFDTVGAESAYEAVFNNSEGLGSVMTNLTTQLDGTDILLEWSLENFSGEITYVEIYRNDQPNFDGRGRILAGAATSGTFVDETAEEGKTYWYMFKVVHDGVTTNTEPEGEIRKPFVSEVPVTNLSTQIVDGTSVEVSWDLQYFDPEITYIAIYRNDVNDIYGRTRILAGAGMSGTIVDDTVESGKTYWYMVKMTQNGETVNTDPEAEITVP